MNTLKTVGDEDEIIERPIVVFGNRCELFFVSIEL